MAADQLDASEQNDFGQWLHRLNLVHELDNVPFLGEMGGVNSGSAPREGRSQLLPNTNFSMLAMQDSLSEIEHGYQLGTTAEVCVRNNATDVDSPGS